MIPDNFLWRAVGDHNLAVIDVVWMIRTKLVHDCEGVVRYLVGWVQDCDLVVCYFLYEWFM